MKLPKFKVGDEVVLTAVPTTSMYNKRKAYTNLQVGKVGKILHVCSDGTAGVEFTTKVFTRPNGKISSADHGCTGRGRKEYSWWIPADCLEDRYNLQSKEVYDGMQNMTKHKQTDSDSEWPSDSDYHRTVDVLTPQQKWTDWSKKSVGAVANGERVHTKIQDEYVPKQKDFYDEIYGGVDPIGSNQSTISCLRNRYGETKFLIDNDSAKEFKQQLDYFEKYFSTPIKYDFDTLTDALKKDKQEKKADMFGAMYGMSRYDTSHIWNTKGFSMIKESNYLGGPTKAEMSRDRAIRLHEDTLIPYIERTENYNKDFYCKTVIGHFYQQPIDVCTNYLNLLYLL